MAGFQKCVFPSNAVGRPNWTEEECQDGNEADQQKRWQPGVSTAFLCRFAHADFELTAGHGSGKLDGGWSPGDGEADGSEILRLRLAPSLRIGGFYCSGGL
jgi:hypothetical protein